MAKPLRTITKGGFELLTQTTALIRLALMGVQGEKNGLRLCWIVQSSETGYINYIQGVKKKDEEFPEQFAQTTLYSMDGNELQQHNNVHRHHRMACMW